jgi:hypothetical protein
MEMRGDAAFGEEDAGSWFENAGHRFLRAEGGKTAANLRGAQNLMRQMMQFGATFGAPKDGAVLLADHQPTGLEQQWFAGQLLEFVPKGVGPLHHGNVNRMLEVSFADDAGLPVGGSEGVGRGKAIEAQDPQAAAGQVKGRRAAHGAEAGDDHVVVGCHAAE